MGFISMLIDLFWLVVFGHPSEKYEFVNWDDEIPNRWENKKWQQTTNQIFIYHHSSPCFSHAMKNRVPKLSVKKKTVASYMILPTLQSADLRGSADPPFQKHVPPH